LLLIIPDLWQSSATKLRNTETKGLKFTLKYMSGEQENCKMLWFNCGLGIKAISTVVCFAYHICSGGNVGVTGIIM
jgi:hypothetical protein